MTNLQDNASRGSALLLRRLWLWLPVAAGTLLTALLVGLVLAPLWSALQRDSQRLRELEAMRDQVSLLRTQLRSLDETEEKGVAQQARLTTLVAGSGDISTFLATVDNEARLSGIQLDLYEPQAPPPEPAAKDKAAATPTPPPPQPGQAAAVPPAASIDVPGLKRTTILMAARGTYPALLSFLKRLEALNVLVVQSDLNLSLEDANKALPGGQAPARKVLLKLALSLYSRDLAKAPAAAAPGTPAAPAAPGSPAAAPAAPAAQGAPPAAGTPATPAAPSASPAPAPQPVTKP